MKANMIARGNTQIQKQPMPMAELRDLQTVQTKRHLLLSLKGFGTALLPAQQIANCMENNRSQLPFSDQCKGSAAEAAFPPEDLPLVAVQHWQSIHGADIQNRSTR